MKIPMYVLAGAMTLTCAVSCNRTDSIPLTVDFTARESWNYDFTVSVGGRAAVRDSSAQFEHSIHCRLSGIPVPADPTALTVTTGAVTLESSMFDEGEAENLKQQLEGFTLTFALREGFAMVGDSMAIPDIGSGQWDLYRHFARMLPVLPKGSVRPGFSWERHKEIPLPTTQGDAVGHLYQSFRFDSLSSAEGASRLAFLSWQFSYVVEIAHGDSTGLLDDLPHKGNGTGRAVLDVDEESLREAEVEFTIPQTSSTGAFAIEWKEKASLKLAGL